MDLLELQDPRDPLGCRECPEREVPVASQEPKETECVADYFLFRLSYSSYHEMYDRHVILCPIG